MAEQGVRLERESFGWVEIKHNDVPVAATCRLHPKVER